MRTRADGNGVFRLCGFKPLSKVNFVNEVQCSEIKTKLKFNIRQTYSDPGRPSDASKSNPAQPTGRPCNQLKSEWTSLALYTSFTSVRSYGRRHAIRQYRRPWGAVCKTNKDDSKTSPSAAWRLNAAAAPSHCGFITLHYTTCRRRRAYPLSRRTARGYNRRAITMLCIVFILIIIYSIQ